MRNGKSGLGIVAVILALVLIIVAALAAILVLRPPFAQPIIDRIDPAGQSTVSSTAAAGGLSADAAPFSAVGDTTPTEEQEVAERGLRYGNSMSCSCIQHEINVLQRKLHYIGVPEWSFRIAGPGSSELRRFLSVG